MLDKLQAICNKYEELSAKSEQPDFYADPQKAAKLLREKNDLEPIVEAFHAYNQAQQDMADAQELMALHQHGQQKHRRRNPGDDHPPVWQLLC